MVVVKVPVAALRKEKRIRPGHAFAWRWQQPSQSSPA